MDAGGDIADTNMVEVIVGDHTFKCNKTHLVKHSDYFRAMFSSNMTECLTNTVTLYDTSATTFSVLLDYVQTQKISFNSENALDILESACIFQFIDVIKHCEDYIVEHLSEGNCISTMCIARSHGVENLYKIAKRMSLWYACKIICTKQIQCLSYQDLKDYLGHILLNIDSELTILQGVDIWMEQHKEMDFIRTGSIFECIKAENLTSIQLTELFSHPLWKKYSGFTEKLEVSVLRKKKHKVEARRRNLPETICILKNVAQQLMVTNSGEIVGPGSHLCAVELGGYGTGGEINTSEITRAPWEGRKNGAIGYRACVIGCCVYVFGGELSLGTGKWIEDVWEFHTLKGLWHTVGRLPSPRRHHSMAVDQNDVYISGGFGRHRILLNTVVKFSVSSGTFEDLEPLPSTMYNCCSLVHNSKLFVFKSSILCLDLSHPSHWCTYLLPSQIDHHITSACIFHGRLYLGYPNDEGLLCEMNPENCSCCLTGKFGSYNKACIQQARMDDTETIEEQLILVGQKQMITICEKDNELKLKGKLDFKGLENTIEYCLLTIPNYQSV